MFPFIVYGNLFFNRFCNTKAEANPEDEKRNVLISQPIGYVINSVITNYRV